MSALGTLAAGVTGGIWKVIAVVMLAALLMVGAWAGGGWFLAARDRDAARVELVAERSANAELRGAIQNLEQSGEEQRAIHEAALSVNEEYQSMNEELLTSKEELQSLNEELTALNTEMQESLKLKRVIADDLQNVLNSTNVATILLDTDLCIRIFTPSTRAVFNVLPTDVGRSLADLHSLAFDADLLNDARTVLHEHATLEREITLEVPRARVGLVDSKGFFVRRGGKMRLAVMLLNAPLVVGLRIDDGVPTVAPAVGLDWLDAQRK